MSSVPIPQKNFLMIVVNDLEHGKTGDPIVSKIKRIIQTVQEKSPRSKIFPKIFLPVNPDFGPAPDHTNKTAEILAINDSLKQGAKELGVNHVDLHSLFIVEDNKLNPEYTKDGLHLKGKAYFAWKSAIEQYVRQFCG